MKRTTAEKNLIKEIQRLKTNLSRSIERVKVWEQKLDTPSIARKKFEQLGKISVKGKSLKQLKRIKRQLTYIKSLKTSKVKGFKRYAYVFDQIMDAIPKDIEDKFWELYNKAVEENQLWEDFKYDLMIELNDSIKAGYSDEQIADRINDLYKNLDKHKDELDPTRFKDWWEIMDWQAGEFD